MRAVSACRHLPALCARSWVLLARYEGGTRTIAFVSGGVVPAARRGTSSDVLMHIAVRHLTRLLPSLEQH